MQISTAFEGAEEIIAKLDQLSARVSRKIVHEALIEGGEPMRRLASQLAPRRPGAPDFADFINIGPVRRSGEDPDDYQVGIGPSMREFFYDFFQEYGTVHQSAHPFYRPAFDTMVPRSLDIIGRALWRELAARGISRSVTAVDRPQSPTGGDLV